MGEDIEVGAPSAKLRGGANVPRGVVEEVRQVSYKGVTDYVRHDVRTPGSIESTDGGAIHAPRNVGLPSIQGWRLARLIRWKEGPGPQCAHRPSTAECRGLGTTLGLAWPAFRSVSRPGVIPLCSPRLSSCRIRFTRKGGTTGRSVTGTRREPPRSDPGGSFSAHDILVFAALMASHACHAFHSSLAFGVRGGGSWVPDSMRVLRCSPT